jgi:hypothetical protein
VAVSTKDRVAALRRRRREANREKARALAGSIVDSLPQQTIGRFLRAVEKDRRLALEHWAIATGEVLTRLPRDKRIAAEAWRRDFKVDAPDPFDILRPRPKPLKSRNGRPTDWYTQRNVVLQRMSHQLVHERRYDETNVFDYTSDGLYWHIKAMQDRPRTRRSKWRYPKVAPELQAEYLARNEEETRRNRATLLAVLKAGTLDATIAAIRRNKVPHRRRRRPNKTILGWMKRWGSPNLRNKYWDEINRAHWKLPLMNDWWPVADFSFRVSSTILLPDPPLFHANVVADPLALKAVPTKDWRPGGDPDAGPDEYSQVRRLDRTIRLIAMEGYGWFPAAPAWDDPEKRPNNLFWHRRSYAPDDDWQIAAENSGALIVGFSYEMRAFLGQHGHQRGQPETPTQRATRMAAVRKVVGFQRDRSVPGDPHDATRHDLRNMLGLPSLSSRGACKAELERLRTKFDNTPPAVNLLSRMELLRAHLGLAAQYDEMIEATATPTLEAAE